MSYKIHIMPPELATKIAAGEIVERPASILQQWVSGMRPFPA